MTDAPRKLAPHEIRALTAAAVSMSIPCTATLEIIREGEIDTRLDLDGDPHLHLAEALYRLLEARNVADEGQLCAALVKFMSELGDGAPIPVEDLEGIDG